MGILFNGNERRFAPVFPEPPVPPVWSSSNVPGGVGYGGRSDKSDAALQVPTVWSCVSLLADAVSSLPLETFRRSSNADVPRRVTDPPLVQSPMSGTPQSAWLHMLMVSLLMRGNAYGIITSFDGYQNPTQIELINPDQVKVGTDSSGRLTYTLGTSSRPVDPATIWHMRGLRLPGSQVGLSPITYAAATIGVDLSSRKFAIDFFDGGGIPKAVLTTDRMVTEESARTTKERLMSSFRNREPILLGQGLQYQTISVPPEESQFLATQAANATQICRYFRVPAHMVDAPSGGSMTYANVEQESLNFLTYSLAPWLKRIEDAFFFLLPQAQYVKFRVEDLLRTDAHNRAQVDMFQIASKVKTPTEIRDSYGLPPMTEAQKAEANMVPLGIGPLGKPTAMPGLNTLPGTPAPTPPDDQQEGAPNAL